MARGRFSTVVSTLAMACVAVSMGLGTLAQDSPGSATPEASPDAFSAAGTATMPGVEYAEEEGTPAIAPDDGIAKWGEFYPDSEYLRRFSHVHLDARMRRPSRDLMARIASDPTGALKQQHMNLFRTQTLLLSLPTTPTLGSDLSTPSETVYAPQPRIEPEPLYAPPAPPAKEGF